MPCPPRAGIPRHIDNCICVYQAQKTGRPETESTRLGYAMRGKGIPPSEKYPRPYRPVVGRNAMKPAGNYDTSICMARQGAAGEYASLFEKERGRFL